MILNNLSEITVKCIVEVIYFLVLGYDDDSFFSVVDNVFVFFHHLQLVGLRSDE